MSDISVDQTGARFNNFLDRAGLRGFPWKTATILYIISWGWLFIVRDSYWADDWNRYVYPQITPFDYRALGLAPWTRLLTPVFHLFGPAVFRLVIFFSYFLAGVCVFGITRSWNFLNSSQRKHLTLLFLILPFGSARVTLMVFHYTTAYFAFFFAWYLLANFKHLWVKFPYLVLFFFSFQMHSLIFFIFLPILQVLYEARVRSLRQFSLFCKDNFVLIFLPLLYVRLRSSFWDQKFDYHGVTDGGLVQFLKIFLAALVLAFIVWIFAARFNYLSGSILVAGIAISVLALMPYVLNGFYVGPKYFVITFFERLLGRSDWDARHQTLQPLGAALLVVGIFGLAPLSRKIGRFAIPMVLVISVIFNAGFGLEYVVDFQKQRAIIAGITTSDTSRFVNELQIIDNTKLLNARGREYRDRDWLGLVALAIGAEKAVDIRKVDGSCSSEGGARFTYIQGPETHWQALKNWVSVGDMGFEVIVDDTPGACRPEMLKDQEASWAIPILFYFTGVISQDDDATPKPSLVIHAPKTPDFEN